MSFMEKRLKIAQQLLNPNGSALIVTIDEREHLRLGLLLEQLFPDATMQMVSTVINAKGTGRANEFRRVDEYIFFLWFGEARLGRLSGAPIGVEVPDVATARADQDGEDDGDTEQGEEKSEFEETTIGLDWQTFRRRDLA